MAFGLASTFEAFFATRLLVGTAPGPPLRLRGVSAMGSGGHTNAKEGRRWSRINVHNHDTASRKGPSAGWREAASSILARAMPPQFLGNTSGLVANTAAGIARCARTGTEPAIDEAARAINARVAAWRANPTQASGRRLQAHPTPHACHAGHAGLAAMPTCLRARWGRARNRACQRRGAGAHRRSRGGSEAGTPARRTRRHRFSPSRAHRRYAMPPRSVGDVCPA